MQTRKCTYCGTTQDNLSYKCLNCGGLLKQADPHKPKQLNKKIMFVFLSLVILIASSLIYTRDTNNTTVAVNTPQPYLIQPGAEISTAAMTHFKIKAKFAQALAEISSIKMLVVEHYHMVGHYPASLTELGFDEKSFDSGELIQAIQFSKKGSIQVFLAPDVFGNNKTLTLTPKVTMGGMNMQWVCTSNLEQHLISNMCKPAV